MPACRTGRTGSDKTMERWVVLAIVAGGLAGLYHVFTKLAAGRIPDVTAAFWLEATAIIVLGIYLSVIREQPWGPAVSRPGLVYAVAGGICVAIAGVLGFVVYRQGMLSVAAPIFVMGSVLVPVIVGIALLHEPVTWTRALGVGLAIVSTWLLLR
ncbi:MAG: EamA family transporter [Candidatus Zixiibacteriota bacterium]